MVDFVIIPPHDPNQMQQDPVDVPQQQQEQPNQALQQPIQPIQPIPPRIRRTHKVSSLLGKLQLREKLIKNKEIEEQNKARDLRTCNNHLDPASHPIPGSETASFITIDESDIMDLKDSSVLARFLAIIPDYLLFRITRENRAEKEKRKADDSNITLENSPDGKRRRMDGTRAAERIVSTQRPIEFSEILFTTNVHVPIPLPFFRNENLRYLIDHAATLPTTKSNPLPGETKGQFILNIAELTKGTQDHKGFGEELSLDFGEWSEAAQNCFRFHQMQDKDGDNGDYARWWSSHFKFFHAQEDKISQYDAWKDLDLKLRREYRTEPTKFDVHHYATKYEAAKTAFEIKALINKDLPQRKDNAYRQPYRGGKPSSSSTSQLRDSRNFNQTASFPPGNRSTHLACCLLCGETGHSVGKHFSDSNHPTKFPDGKPIWAKIANGKLCGPNNKEICINYNISGGSNNCTHSEGVRTHCCAFCGSKTHHAFSWTCRTRPSPN